MFVALGTGDLVVSGRRPELNLVNLENRTIRASIAAVVMMAIPSWAFAQGGLAALFSDKHTVFFLAVNLFLTFYFVVMRFDRFAVVHGPEILTTMGIFGCFFGIALALLDFDPRDVPDPYTQYVKHFIYMVKRNEKAGNQLHVYEDDEVRKNKK